MHTVHNARVTLLATALNNLGVAAIGAGIITPAVKGYGDLGHIAAWLILGADLIAAAQALLGRLRA
jgi:hypothetical protein